MRSFTNLFVTKAVISEIRYLTCIPCMLVVAFFLSAIYLGNMRVVKMGY